MRKSLIKSDTNEKDTSDNYLKIFFKACFYFLVSQNCLTKQLSAGKYLKTLRDFFFLR